MLIRKISEIETYHIGNSIDSQCPIRLGGARMWNYLKMCIVTKN